MLGINLKKFSSVQYYKVALVMVLIIIALITFVESIQFPSGMLWSSMQNSGHVLLFGIYALIVLVLSRRYFGSENTNPLYYYLIAFIASFIVGGLLEVVQIYGPRDADIWDLIRDLCGASSFLLIYLPFDKNALPKLKWWRGWYKYLSILIGIAIIIFSIASFLSLGASYIYKQQNFPVICGFNSELEKPFIRAQSARFKLVKNPAIPTPDSTGSVGQLELSAKKYPGISFVEPGDWTGYQKLKLFIYSEQDTTINIWLWISDVRHRNSEKDRFSRNLRIKPGANNIEVSLDDIKAAVQEGEMNLADIAYVFLYAPHPKNEFVLYFDELRLE